MSDLDQALRAQLRHTLESTPWTTIGGKQLERYDGKVRDCFIDRDKGERIIVVTDRLSAFDAVVGTIPSKGQVLNQLATAVIQLDAQLRVREANPRRSYPSTTGKYHQSV